MYYNYKHSFACVHDASGFAATHPRPPSHLLQPLVNVLKLRTPLHSLRVGMYAPLDCTLRKSAENPRNFRCTVLLHRYQHRKKNYYPSPS